MTNEPAEWSPDEAGASPGVGLKEKKRRKRQPKNTPKKIPRYNVVLWNDDVHTFDYVVKMLKELFGHAQDMGFRMAQTVHTQGRVIVLTTTLEHAEFKRDQIHGFGADPLVEECVGSMSASVEKVEEE